METTGSRAARPRLRRMLASIVALGVAATAYAAIVIDPGYYASANGFYPGTATASFHLTSGGDVLVNGVDEGDWISPKTGMSNYQYRATYDGGCGAYGGSNLTGSALNTWTSLGGGANWFATAIGEGDQQLCQVEIEIRATANPSVILATSQVVFQASVW